MGPDANVKMAMISGSQTDANALLFSIGVHNVLDPLFATKQYSTVDEVFTPDWSPINALSEATSILATNRDMQVFYVANDDMAASVITALHDAKVTQPIIITGQDATIGGIHNILLGKQGMTVYKPIVQEADSVGQLVKAIHDGSSTQSLTKGQVTATYDNGSIPSILDAPVSVTIDNIASTVIKDGFLNKDDVCKDIPAGTDTHGVC